MSIFLSIITFVLGLCVVICIHEAGHLTMAKLFKVYCTEFSIGWGPKILSINPKDKKTGKKKWETSLNIRLLPIGGFVAMVGEANEKEGADDPDLPKVPKDRVFSSIAYWKQAIVMVAGILMNVFLSFFLFLSANLFTPQQDVYTNRFTVSQNLTINGESKTSPMYEAGFQSGDRITYFQVDFGTYGAELDIQNGRGDSLSPAQYEALKKANVDHPGWTVDPKGLVSPLNSQLILQPGKDNYPASYNNVNAVMSPLIRNQEGDLIDGDGNPIVSSQGLYIGTQGDVNDVIRFVPKFDPSNPTKAPKGYVVNLTYATKESNYQETHEVKGLPVDPVPVLNDQGSIVGYSFGSLGLGAYYSYSPTRTQEGDDQITWGSFGRSIVQSFVDQGNGIVNVYSALGHLFTPAGWRNVGGVVSMFVMNEEAVSAGAYAVLNLWGLISINLAVMNLLPFPGLDGWQLLICVVEGVFKKKIPTKVKSIVSAIGLALLCLLMVGLLAMDIVRLM